MNANGLSFGTIKSEARAVAIRDGLLDMLVEHFLDSKAFIVAYLDYRVVIGRFEGGSFSSCDNETIEAKFIQKLRVFDHEKELLIWRSRDGLNGRLRIDSEGQDTDVVDAEQVLFGTEANDMGDFTRLTEDRGTEIILPFIAIDFDGKRKRVCMKTRNYIDYNKFTHQANYVDCRFVGFSCAGNNLGRRGRDGKS